MNTKVLSESVTLTTLNDKLQKLIILEKSDASLSSLSNGMECFANIALTKQSNRNKQFIRDKKPEQFSGEDRCLDCKKNHKQYKNCGGYHKCTTKCNLCKQLGHIKNCSNKQSRSYRTEVEVNENNGDVAFCFTLLDEGSSSNVGDNWKHDKTRFSLSISTELVHHVEFVHKKFRKSSLHHSPLLKITRKLLHGYYEKRGRNIPVKQKGKLPASIQMEGLVNTGAQICTAGVDLMESLGINKSYLIPTTMKVKGGGGGERGYPFCNVDIRWTNSTKKRTNLNTQKNPKKWKF